ncbi:MAG TPA: hypothetical protein VM223_23930 [Planctomycetota bacterium]|nr:hypothetical protein [Planctomycetota bacterium]
MKMIRAAVFAIALAAAIAGCRTENVMENAARKQPPEKLNLSELPLLPPTALTGDAGDGRAYLRWNLQLEDERITGWKVVQLTPEQKTLTDVLTDPYHVVRELPNGAACTFAVVGVTKDGIATSHSNTVTVTPRETGTAKVSGLPKKTKITVGEHRDVELPEPAAKVVFPDGQELIFARYRPADWKTADGEHLIYPGVFGNGLDIGKFGKNGLPLVIPPEGLTRDSIEIDGATFKADGPGFAYVDAQHGTSHPFITDPYTLSLQQYHHDARDRWFDPIVDGDRVTFHWWQPMLAMGYRSWIYVLVWETWWPVERDLHGTKYRGLARLVEVQMPDSLKDGYQVMLNNGFGPGGSRRGVISYSSGFRRPSTEIVDFSGDTNRQVYFQHPKQPRRESYHPNQDCLQSSPLIFYDWGTGADNRKAGCLMITARSLYYHCAQSSSTYAEQDADGVWPNLAWDMAISGKRTPVDTVEYLYTSDVALPLPQRYTNARFDALTNVSHRMGVQDTLAAASVEGTLGAVKGDGGPVAHADKMIERYKAGTVDGIHIFHDLWHAVPITVDDAYRLDENHDCNPQLKAMCDRFLAAGMHPGFWYRPEFTKTAITNVLSSTIPTAETYYGYNECDYPDVPALLHERGISILHENTHWIRRQRDGSWPVNTPYQWVPMSMATDWWNRIMWPTLLMSRKLGFDWILMDGGFGGLCGVDYAPRLNGQTDSAVACQPYWWRMFRSMQHIGMKNYGECTLGWKGGFVNLTGEGDQFYIWMYQCSSIWGNNDLGSPEQLHKLFQLYNSTAGRHNPDATAVYRYAIKFRKEHRPPDWIEFVDLKQGEPQEVTVKVAESPVAGAATRVTEADSLKYTVRPWTWTDVIWHYDDGTRAVYPAYEKVEWGKE